MMRVGSGTGAGTGMDVNALKRKLDAANTGQPVQLTPGEVKLVRTLVGDAGVDVVSGQPLTPEQQQVLREFLASRSPTSSQAHVRSGGVKLNDAKNAPIANDAPLHIKSRTEKPDSYPARVSVPDDKVSWRVPFDAYRPTYHVDPIVLTASWAEPEDIKSSAIKRPFKSNAGVVDVDEKGHPLNPMGRTGVEGRGLLGKWGANQAGDPIVTRANPDTGKLELLVIQRKDSGQWALPGGMVDDGEQIFKTVARELHEETGVKLDFSDAKHVYQGYVDDRRNTDNAWMETTVKHKHISGRVAAHINPKAGDDAKAVRWISLDRADVESLYASHGAFVKQALKQMLKDPSLSPTIRAQIRSILA